MIRKTNQADINFIPDTRLGYIDNLTYYKESIVIESVIKLKGYVDSSLEIQLKVTNCIVSGKYLAHDVH